MKMILLTSIGGAAVLINAGFITRSVRMVNGKGEESTDVFIRGCEDRSRISVRETPEQIFKILYQCKPGCNCPDCGVVNGGIDQFCE